MCVCVCVCVSMLNGFCLSCCRAEHEQRYGNSLKEAMNSTVCLNMLLMYNKLISIHCTCKKLINLS